MAEDLSTAYLFSTCHRDPDEDFEFWSYVVGAGHDPQQAWVAVADEAKVPDCERVDQKVYALSCDAVLTEFDPGDLAALWPPDDERPWGDLLVDEHGQAVPSWTDRGPMQVLETVSVYEYRSPRPGSTGLEEDEVRHSTTRLSLVLEHDGHLLMPEWEAPEGEFWPLPDGMRLPQVVAPADPRTKEGWSYLACWFFVADQDADLPDLIGGCGVRELRGLEGVRVERRADARDVMLERWQHYGSRWVPAADPAEDFGISGLRGLRTFELLMPYDPRPVTDLLPGPDGEIGEIAEVTETVISAADLVEHPRLGGYVRDTGYRVKCLAGVSDTDGDDEMLWAKLRLQILVADAACALSRLTMCAESDGKPWHKDLEDYESIVDLRTVAGYGDEYVIDRADRVFLIERSRARTRLWQLEEMEPERIALLASHLDPQQLPRLGNPGAQD